MNNLPVILKEGLKSKTPFARPKKVAGVYLSSKRFRWMFWATDKGITLTEENMYLVPVGCELIISTSGLKLIPDNHGGYSKDEKRIDPEKDFICISDIPKEDIIGIAMEVREDPHKFGPFIEYDVSWMPDGDIMLTKGGTEDVCEDNQGKE